jgi:hypothetical protein
VLDPLCDAGSSCRKSSDLDTIVEVMALGDEEGGDSPCPARPSLERLLPQEQDAPLPEQDALDIAVVELRTARPHCRPCPGRGGPGMDAPRPPQQGGPE